ncbi:hypothetical protein [Maridesulfovibrio sp. FT414]|uniref:hypothetical protein n=1 Tax=Maridesulfovibrio sp. FT414 TaxID=2979469 RepID=UPI003D807D1C
MSRLTGKSKVTLGIPTLEDVERVAATIRPSDRRDMEGLHPGMSIRDIIMRDVEYSRVVYGLYMGGDIHAVFGVVPLAPGKGVPWLTAATAVDLNPLPFARISRRMLDMVQKCFPVLDTWVCAENRVSVNWHRWCGFEFAENRVLVGRDEYFRAVRRIEIINMEDR